MGQPSRKERDKERHRSEILAAAEKEFAEKGFHGATTEGIAHRSEFAVGTLYKFFDSKEEIYAAVLMDGLERRLEAVRGIFSDRNRDPREAIEQYIEDKAKFFSARPYFFRLFLKEYLGDSPILSQAQRARMPAFRQEALELMRKTIERGIRQGVYKRLPARDVAVALEAQTTTFLHDSLFGAGPDYAKRVQTMKTLFFEGALAK